MNLLYSKKTEKIFIKKLKAYTYFYFNESP